MAIPFLNSRTQWLDADGNPYSYGRVTFYQAGTSTPKAIYTGPDEAVEADNPMLLDSGGYFEEDVWLGTGDYKYMLEKITGYDGLGDPIYTAVYTKDNIPGVQSLVDGILTTAVIETVQDLRDISGSDYSAVYCLGHTTVDDEGGGWFRYNATTGATDDNGMVISPVGSPGLGRWERVVEGNIIYNTYYGIIAGDTTADYQGAIQNMSNFCNVNPEFTMWFRPGGYNISGNIAFQNTCNLVFEDRVFFTNELSVTPAVVSIFSRQVDIKQRTSIVNYADTRLIYDPVVGPTAILKWFDDYLGLVADNSTVLEWVAGGGLSSGADFIVESPLRSASLTPIDLSGHKVIFEDGAYIQLDGQDLTVEDYENRHGGQIWDDDVEGLTVNTIKKIRVSEFVGSNAITSTELSKLTNFATSASTVDNYIYFDNGAYTYDSAGSPTGDNNLTYVFENSSSLAVTGTIFLYDIVGNQCISGLVRSEKPVKLSWFTGFDDAVESANASFSSNILECDNIEVDLTSAYSFTLTRDIVIKDINLFNDTVNGPTASKLLSFTGAFTVEFIGGKIISETSNIGAIGCSESSLVMDGVKVRANDNDVDQYIISCVRASYGGGTCKIINSDIAVEDTANNTELIYAFQIEDVNINNNIIEGRVISGAPASSGKIVIVSNGLYSSFDNNICKGYTTVSVLGTGITSIDGNTHPYTITVDASETIYVNGNDCENLIIDTKIPVSTLGAITGNSGSSCTIGSNIKVVTDHRLIFDSNKFQSGDTTNYVGLKTDTDTTTDGGAGQTITLTADFSDIPVKTGEIEVTYHLVYDVTSGVASDYFRSGVVTTSSYIASVSYDISAGESVTGTAQFIQVMENR